ncbi:substrate-binding domain-containing protein [Streptomyces sp. NPDC058011]|uniref:substrate-binding domain-containing protein n=1 Tax=Streptomyces sp. NPDC058011 TaxID=3346305 RepID=UPI0036EA23F9
MGRHSLPDAHAPEERGGTSPRRRRRTVAVAVAVATLLVLAVATGTGVAVNSGLLSFSESCEDSAVRLLAASPGIAPAVRDIAEQALADEVRSDGHCLDVEVVARDSYKVADTLASQVVTAALTSDKVRLGAADPARSATGLLALTSIGGSSAQQGGDSDTRVAETAKVLAERMSDSDAQVLETLARSDAGAEDGNPRRNQAVLISEQAAFTHNAEATGGGKLNLFYPEDGTPLLDYPYTLVDEEKLPLAQSRAALRFMTLLNDRSSRAVLSRYGFRPPSGAAEDTVVASAGGKSPQPYATSAAEPPSAKQLQEMLGMWKITVQSARLTTVVDASGSMSTLVPGRGLSRMDVTKESLIQALTQFTPDDEIGLWEFATTLDGAKDYRKVTETRRLGDPVQGGSTHREKLSAAFAGLQPVPGGATGLYDTTLASYEEARSTFVKGKFNALVILTDGSNQDDDGISRSALIDRLKELADPERPVPIIAIAVGPDADREEAAEIARVTGGDGYEVSDPAEIQAVILRAIMAAGQNGRAAQE